MGLPKYKNGFELTLHPDTLNDPLEWKKPRKIFVNSMSDLFHKDVPLDFIQQVFDVMGRARQHRFQVLTKRSARLLELSDQLAWAPNIWMGVSVEGENYVHRIDKLRRTGAAIKFLSVEPLLGPISGLDLTGIDQVIVGGESGPGARPMEEDWVQAILRDCRAQHVCFFFKQWGGPKKNLTGRILNGRTYDEEPGPRTHSIPEHPAAAIFAKMSEEELRRLADDIRENGQREPIVLTQEGMILDGRNRAAACEWAGLVPLETTVWDGVPGEELQFVLSRNIHRRHLNESQRAMAAALAREMVNGIRRGGGKVVNLPPGSGTKTAEILGELFSVSEKLVRLAMPISGCPVLCEAVQSGRYKVSAVSRLVKLSPAEQRQRLDEWDKAKVRTPAATAEKDDSPPVPNWVVDLNATEMDLARPNLTADATVVIKGDSLQIGAAVALLSRWKVPITDVRCEQGAFQPGAILLIGGRLPETWDESAFRNGLGALQAVVAEDFIGPNTAEQDPCRRSPNSFRLPWPTARCTYPVLITWFWFTECSGRVAIPDQPGIYRIRHSR
jgi:protein gp37